MRTLSLAALILLAISTLGYCGNNLGWSALLILLVLCGVVLALIASILGIISTIQPCQWGWLGGLIAGFLAPLHAGPC
jgi:hypothetical protein